MNKNEDKNEISQAEMEKWLNSLFLDPFTSYLDEIMFRVDLYDTDSEIIVEALLPDKQPSDIKVNIKDKQLIIIVSKEKDPSSKNETLLTRNIDFPFPIIHKLVIAKYNNGILEVFISKNKKGSGKDRTITLPN